MPRRRRPESHAASPEGVRCVGFPHPTLIDFSMMQRGTQSRFAYPARNLLFGGAARNRLGCLSRGSLDRGTTRVVGSRWFPVNPRDLSIHPRSFGPSCPTGHACGDRSLLPNPTPPSSTFPTPDDVPIWGTNSRPHPEENPLVHFTRVSPVDYALRESASFLALERFRRTAPRTSTVPRLAPGTGPLTRIKPLSRSTLTTSAERSVTRSSPM